MRIRQSWQNLRNMQKTIEEPYCIDRGNLHMVWIYPPPRMPGANEGLVRDPLLYKNIIILMVTSNILCTIKAYLFCLAAWT